MGSVMIMAAIIIGLSAATIVVSHATIVGCSVETASLEVSTSVHQLKLELSEGLEKLREVRGDK